MKELQDMSLEELWQLFPIVQKEHSSQFAAWLREEKEFVLRALETLPICRISHIGRTSAHGLLARPIVDILLEMPTDCDMDRAVNLLQDDGWILMGRNTRQRTLDLNKGYTPMGFAEKVYHLHVKPSGDCDELYFWDYLQQYRAVARQYEELKINLGQRYKHDRNAYTEANTDFVRRFSQMGKEEFPGRYLPE